LLTGTTAPKNGRFTRRKLLPEVYAGGDEKTACTAALNTSIPVRWLLVMRTAS
jgi:hypothetical protein